MPAIATEKAIGWIEGKLGIKLALGQQEAICQDTQQKMLVITGGPGVGRTTLVRSILEIFQAKNMKCVLAAPTCRLAKRLAETTRQTAKTIHRLLEFDPAGGDFKRDQQDPLTEDERIRIIADSLTTLLRVVFAVEDDEKASPFSDHGPARLSESQAAANA
jgi:exodeoxyribonuclease V alpha subunit